MTRFASTPGRSRTRAKEVTMFEMVNEHKADRDPKALLLKIGLFVAGLAVLGGAVYFFAFTGAPR
jgi:hypothetical protein